MGIAWSLGPHFFHSIPSSGISCLETRNLRIPNLLAYQRSTPSLCVQISRDPISLCHESSFLSLKYLSRPQHVCHVVDVRGEVILVFVVLAVSSHGIEAGEEGAAVIWS